jgi:hypothetical protein
MKEVHGALPLFDGGGEKALGGRAAGVGDADVGAAEFLDHGVDEIANGVSVGYVERFGENFCLVLAANLFGGGAESFLAARTHGDPATFGGKGLGRGAAKPLAGCGHDSDAALESGFHSGPRSEGRL